MLKIWLSKPNESYNTNQILQLQPPNPLLLPLAVPLLEVFCKQVAFASNFLILL